MAQTARKPSYYENQAKNVPHTTIQQNTPNTPPEKPEPLLTSVPIIDNQKTFNQLARTYELGTLYEIPHILFIIDLQDNNRTYYLNTPYFELHENFIQKEIVNKTLSRQQLNDNYLSKHRRFLLGTLSWQNSIQAYTYEFWEGDTLAADFLKLTDQQINQSFFDKVTFKTNSTRQQQTAQQANLSYVTQQQLIKQQPYLALNTGVATGKLRIIENIDQLDSLNPTDIIILKETPISLPPIAAVITEQPSTILSHVNLLAKSLKIPNVYIKNAATELANYDQQWITLKVTPSRYSITPAKEISTLPLENTAPITSASKVNITTLKLFPLKKLRVKDHIYCGSKAANLGEISNRLAQVNVPDGFCIPFGQYQQFMEQHGLFKQLKQLENNTLFQTDSKFRKEALSQFREKIINTPIDKQSSKQWQKQWLHQLAGKAVFVRSSSNSEDLANFNGAGLYTSVPNITNFNDLQKAIKTVWASTFNYEAYESRRLLKLPDDLIKMSVFIQHSIDADKSGVLITTDPFDPTHPHITYIAAKRGLGIKVVEGQAMAEQVMYSTWSKAIQILTLSEEQTALKTSATGGVKEQLISTNDRILNDQLIVKLADLGSRIKYLFIYNIDGKQQYQDQDIEWAEKEGKIFILQSRPYIH